MKAPPEKTVTRPAGESPAAWFVELERARIDRDFARAAEAQRQLERLGVKVRYTGKGASRG